jgi:hypothetical protein
MSYSGASVDVVMRTSIHGERLGLGDKGQLLAKGIPITSNAADAVITIPAAQATAIVIQFNNADGTPISHVQDFDLYVVSLTSGAISALATTGGSTGIAIGANGFIAKTVTAKLMFKCFTDATGKFTATWTDNAAEVAFLAVMLPSGRPVISAQLPTS